MKQVRDPDTEEVLEECFDGLAEAFQALLDQRIIEYLGRNPNGRPFYRRAAVDHGSIDPAGPWILGRASTSKD
jgi:hypothetical protein